MGDTVFGGTKPSKSRLSPRSARKTRARINKPKKLIDELQARSSTKSMGEGVVEMWREDVKESPTFNSFFKPENKSKNVRADVLLYDMTRVRLEGGGSDYYHASWIDGCSRERQYILAQAPMKTTYDDFVRLVQQTKAEAIVLLQGTDSEEGKLMKKSSAVEKLDGGWEMFSLEGKTKVYSLTGWTEDAKPPSGLIEALEKLRKAVSYEWKSLLMVVCRDGATRSGVFALMDIEYERVSTKGKMKLVDTIKLMRHQRSNVFDEFAVFDAAFFLHLDLAKKFS